VNGAGLGNVEGQQDESGHSDGTDGTDNGWTNEKGVDIELRHVGGIGPGDAINSVVSHFTLDFEGWLLRQEALRLNSVEIRKWYQQRVQCVEDTVREAVMDGRQRAKQADDHKMIEHNRRRGNPPLDAWIPCDSPYVENQAAQEE
jgi:hypothetical protein